MIDALVSGRVLRAPEMRTDANGRPYATFLLAAVDKNGESNLVSCMAFSASAIEVVRHVETGDALAVAGELSFSEWTGRDGTDRRGYSVIVHSAMSAYCVRRKRGALHRLCLLHRPHRRIAVAFDGQHRQAQAPPDGAARQQGPHAQGAGRRAARDRGGQWRGPRADTASTRLAARAGRPRG